MSMACSSSSLFSPNLHIFSTRPTKNLLSYPHNHLSFNSLQCNENKREFSIPSVASISYQPINVDYLEKEFSGHGVTFEDIGESCVAKISLENGSVATLMLPSGLITSYKAPMWHGATVELLHTLVTEGDNGSALVQGGVSLAFSCGSDGEVPWSPCNWTLRDITGNPEDSIQVELICLDTEKMVEMRYVVTLREDVLSSELIVSNSKSSAIRLTGSVISHLTVSTPEAVYAVGLEGSDFYNKLPLSSNFVIVPPYIENKFSISQLWSQIGLGLGARNEPNGDEADNNLRESEEEMEGEENDNYKQLTDLMSKIYTSAPSEFTIIDRGRRNSVVSGRYGFEEVYIFSPGSSHEFYSKYAYICIGQSAMLKPVIVEPGAVWRGGQHLHNPNG